MLSCLVDKYGNAMYPWPHLEHSCLKYEFDLEGRKITPAILWTPFPRDSTHDKAASDYFDERTGTPEKLMAFSRMGYLDKLELASVLSGEKRQVYLDMCFNLEIELTKRCGDGGDPCLADGCAFEKTGEACLNAVLLSKDEYLKRCASIWEDLFVNPDNRIDIWKS